jgi:ankyrin repeat protein
MPIPTRKLPSQPNLEQLRKQAKDLHTQFLAGDAQAIAEAKQHEWRLDPAGSFALNDAQRVLARAYGFDSWSKLKAFVDGANIRRFVDSVEAGDSAQVRTLLNARPELVTMDLSSGDERRALHFAVIKRDVAMTRLLMEAGADARQGVYPHRSATTPLALATARGFDDIVAVIEEEERSRREELSCPNATVSPVQDQISEAIHNGDRAGAIALLEADKSLIQACDRQGATPLHIAAQVGDHELIEWLLARRANVRKQDVRGYTALDHAVLTVQPGNGMAELLPGTARLLLERGGAELTVRAAVALGDVANVRKLISANPAALRELTSRGGLLSVAVNHNQIEVAGLLLDLGADVDERTTLNEVEEPTLSWGHPLWYAALAGQRDMVQLLLDRGADPNANVYASGWPLRNAWHHEDDSVKRLLLARGAKLPPFMVGELHDVEEARRLLQQDPVGEQIACELLESAGDTGCPEIVEMALARLDWPRADSKWRWYLIQPIRGVGADGKSHEGHFRCLDILLRHGIHPDVAAFGQTALHFTAGWHGDLTDEERGRFARMLLDHGARVDVRDLMLQSTPLAWACRWGRKAMVEVLLSRGAPVDEPDAEPWATPMAWAEKMQHGDILQMLRGHSQSR